MTEKDLKIGYVYQDKHIGRVRYMGKWETDFYMKGHKGRKGKHTFMDVNFSKNCILIAFSKKEVTDLTPLN